MVKYFLKDDGARNSTVCEESKIASRSESLQ